MQVLRRLAQNKEAARKSRLRKKVVTEKKRHLMFAFTVHANTGILNECYQDTLVK